MLIYEISSVIRAAARKINSIDYSKPAWVKQLSRDDQRYRKQVIGELEREGIWDRKINIPDSEGNPRPLNITLVQRGSGDVLELLFSIDHDFVKPKHRKNIQDTKLARSTTKLVVDETVQILHTIRPQQLKFSAVLKDREGRDRSQGDSRARLYDSIVSKATPYLEQIGYSVDINQKKATTTSKMEKIEWLITRVGKPHSKEEVW